MFERFSEKARRVIFFSRYHASEFGSPYIETGHLLLGLMHEDDGIFKQHGRGVTRETFSKELESQTPRRDRISTSVDLPVSAEARRALEYAAEEADRLEHREIEIVHLLLGLLRIEDCVATVFLRGHGVDYAGYLETVRSPAETAASRKEPVVSEVEALAPSLASSIAAIQSLVTLSSEALRVYAEFHGDQRLKRKPLSRKEALGHLVNLAIAHHLWLARALTEPRVAAGVYPLEEWVVAQQYGEYRWAELVDLWISLNRLLVHILCAVPEDKSNTVVRVGIEEPQTLRALIDRYSKESDDLMGQILARL